MRVECVVIVCWLCLPASFDLPRAPVFFCSVRYEAATTLAALLRALPHLAGPLLLQACHELEAQHAHLIQLAVHKAPQPSGPAAPGGASTEEARARAVALAGAKADAERKKRAMFSLHGRTTVRRRLPGIAPCKEQHATR